MCDYIYSTIKCSIHKIRKNINKTSLTLTIMYYLILEINSENRNKTNKILFQHQLSKKRIQDQKNPKVINEIHFILKF